MDVVLLHGFAATSFTWRDVVGPLSDDNHVIALDRRFGPVPDAVAATAQALVDERLEGPVLVGHSAGAQVAALVATRPEVAPRGLVLVGPVLEGGPPALVRRLAGTSVLRRAAPPLLRAGIRVGLGPALRRAWADKARCTTEVVDGYRAPLLAAGVAEDLWAMTAADPPPPIDWPALAGVPTLVVVGEHDRWATEVPLPHATVVRYAGCGHLPHEEQPERFIEDLRRFLDGVDDGGR